MSFKDAIGKNLRFVIALSLTLFLAEIITSILTGSSVILADGIHVYSNLFAILLAWSAYVMSEKEHPDRMCICLRKKDIYFMVINAVIIISLAVTLIYRATVNLIYPQDIDAGPVLVISLFALTINWFLLGLFRTHRHRDLKKITFHLYGNFISSVIVVCSALFSFVLELEIFDVIGTYLLAIVVFANTINLAKRSFGMAFSKKTDGINNDRLYKDILKTKNVKAVIKLSHWKVYDDETVLNAKLRIRTKDKHHTTKILEAVKRNISHHNFGFIWLQIIY